MRRFPVVIAAIALSVCAAAAEPVTVTAVQIPVFSRSQPERTQCGDLSFRGGLVLDAANSGFGGLSGLRVDASGTDFRAITDRGDWLQGRIAYDGERPVGIKAAELDPILGADGNILNGRDAEALEISGDDAWIATERVHRVLHFDLSKGVAAARGTPIAVPKAFADLPSNAGIEAMGLVPEGSAQAGRLLAVTEESDMATGNHLAWLLPGRTTRPVESLSVKSHDGFAVTDLTFLPGGDLVVLERRFVAPQLSIRVRRIAAADIAPGATLDGRVLMEADLSQEIDNMEGISATRAADGTTVLTLISDDNFSLFQRTVLLQFGLKE